MLIHPALIVAFLLHLIVGPPTISQQFTRFRSLGHGIHRKISSILFLPHTSPREYPSVSEPITVEALSTALVEIHPSCPVPLEDYVQVFIPDVCPTRHDNRTTLPPTRVFVVASGYQGPFSWRDLFSYQVLNVLTVVYFSVWFPLVTAPLISELFSRSGSQGEPEQPVDARPKLLPPKHLTPPPTVRIQIVDLKSHAPPEPIFSPAPPTPSTFWLAREYFPTIFHPQSNHQISQTRTARPAIPPLPSPPPPSRLLGSRK